MRELREETGLTAVAVCEVLQLCVSDPGMTGANMQYVALEVDGDAPENQAARQALEVSLMFFLPVHCCRAPPQAAPVCGFGHEHHRPVLPPPPLPLPPSLLPSLPTSGCLLACLQDGEFITVHLVPWDGLLDALLRIRQDEGWDIDARLLSFAWGLHHAQAAAAEAAAVATAADATAARLTGAAASQPAGSQTTCFSMLWQHTWQAVADRF